MQITRQAWVGGRYVDLVDVLRIVGDHGWVWRLEELEGVSRPESPYEAYVIERTLRTEGPMTLGWTEVMSLALGMEQTVWCMLVAIREGSPEPVLRLECVDSTLWEITAPDDDADGTEVLRRIAREWPEAGA